MFMRSTMSPKRSALYTGYPRFLTLAHGGLKNVVVRSLPELKIRSDDEGIEPTIKCGAPKTVHVASQAPVPILNMTIYHYQLQLLTLKRSTYMVEPHQSISIGVCAILVLQSSIHSKNHAVLARLVNRWVWPIFNHALATWSITKSATVENRCEIYVHPSTWDCIRSISKFRRLGIRNVWKTRRQLNSIWRSSISLFDLSVNKQRTVISHLGRVQPYSLWPTLWSINKGTEPTGSNARG